jgi:hypothetical protein
MALGAVGLVSCCESVLKRLLVKVLENAVIVIGLFDDPAICDPEAPQTGWHVTL